MKQLAVVLLVFSVAVCPMGRQKMTLTVDMGITHTHTYGLILLFRWKIHCLEQREGEQIERGGGYMRIIQEQTFYGTNLQEESLLLRG